MITEITNFKDFLDAVGYVEGCLNAYLSYEYFEVFCKTYKKYEKNFLAFKVEDKNGKILGVFPLVKEKYYYIPLCYRYSNYLGYICADNDIKEMDESLVAYINQKYKNMIIMYYDINNRDNLYEILKNDRNSKSIFLYNCPYCSVDDSFENVFSRQITKSKKRSEMRKFEKKLRLIGELNVFHIDDSQSWEKYSKYFQEIFEIHKKRFSKVFIPSELCLYKNSQYYSQLFENMVKKGKAYISIMTLDDKVISFVYSVVSGTIIQDWMPAFDPAFSKYNLGTVHLMKIIEYVCGSDRYTVFDFSKGNGVYKERWCNGVTCNFMFIRRYSDNFLAKIKQSVLYVPYYIKGWLRNHGYMSKIKRILAKLNKQEEAYVDLSNSTYDIVETNEMTSADETWEDFSYIAVRKYDMDVQYALLTAYYTEPFSHFSINGNQIIVKRISR